ncbi:MAG: transcriptional regulator [Elusimicrobia bacterium]|nr:transcriptional regulator [Elusimicrobiota bacterium]
MKSTVSASVGYRDDLLRRLKEPEFAAGYLSKSLEDDEATFLVALRDVAEAHGGIREMAKKTRLNREHLFRMLSKTGNPHLHSLRQLVGAVGLKLTLQPA